MLEEVWGGGGDEFLGLVVSGVGRSFGWFSEYNL